MTILQNSQNVSGTGNTRVNTLGIQNVRAMFHRVRVRSVGYEVLTDLSELSDKVLQNSKNCRVRYNVVQYSQTSTGYFHKGVPHSRVLIRSLDRSYRTAG